MWNQKTQHKTSLLSAEHSPSLQDRVSPLSRILVSAEQTIKACLLEVLDTGKTNFRAQDDTQTLILQHTYS